MKDNITFGDKVRDRLTGIEGTAYGRSTYMTGCDHIGIKRLGTKADGGAYDIHWADAPMIEIVEKQAFKIDLPHKERANGGPALHNMSRT